ncbi:MAG: GNAT family N-acetyltransferase [Bacteroidetes bacterium]|nr:GNAT family N-acetyltransferase [Bacteroidota bacterium]
MKLIKIDNKRKAKEFLDTARVLYKNDRNWICPPDVIIESIFDRKKNSYFKTGEAERWVLKDNAGNLTGRVAAFYRNEPSGNQKTGGMGFFECIQDREAAFLLFETCESWLKEKGIDSMEGPVNFGEGDNSWGLLVEGFTPPGLGMNYNPLYYREFFEAYGFEPEYTQETQHLDLTKPFPERFWKIAEWVFKKPGYSFEHFDKKNPEKYAPGIAEIYNSAWKEHNRFSPIGVSKVLKRLKEVRQIIIDDFIWFVYFNGRPIAFLVMLPDMNQLFRLFNGKMNPLNKIRFMFLKNSKVVTRSRITIMGVVPGFQGKGIESAMFWHLQEPLLIKRPHYKEIEISWVGDYNPKMKATLDAMGAAPGKKHITYRKTL